MLDDANNSFLHRDKWDRVKKAFEQPIIIHYTKAVKPWHLEYQGPFKNVFLKYKSLSLWSDYALLRIITQKQRYCFIITNMIKKIFGC
jgi:lipopolysaccharide biosynthesis glycosyltransferase